jgi:hypothetical protein
MEAKPQTHLSLSLWVRLEVKILLPLKAGLKVLRMKMGMGGFERIAGCGERSEM